MTYEHNLVHQHPLQKKREQNLALPQNKMLKDVNDNQHNTTSNPNSISSTPNQTIATPNSKFSEKKQKTKKSKRDDTSQKDK